MPTPPLVPTIALSSVTADRFGPTSAMVTVSPGMKPVACTPSVPPAVIAPGVRVTLAGRAPALSCAEALRWLVVPVATRLTVPSGVFCGSVRAAMLKVPSVFTCAVPRRVLVESATRSTVTVSPGWKCVPLTAMLSPGLAVFGVTTRVAAAALTVTATDAWRPDCWPVATMVRLPAGTPNGTRRPTPLNRPVLSAVAWPSGSDAAPEALASTIATVSPGW